MSNKVTIEVVFADVDQVYIERFNFNYEPQVIEIIELITTIPQHARNFPCSVWGAAVGPAYRLKNNDRLELTREIVADPKHSRARKVNALPRRGWVQRLR